jgi:hypothetical protein
VLAVGWGAKYARRRPRSLWSADLWRQVANREAANREAVNREAANHEATNREAASGQAASRQRQPADPEDFSSFNRLDAVSRRTRLSGICDLDRLAAELGSREPLAELWRGDAHAPALTPTDPADDLKTSLAELMRDLRRAGAFAPEEQTPAHHADAQHHTQDHVKDHAQERVEEHDLEHHDPVSLAHDGDAEDHVEDRGRAHVQDHDLDDLGPARLEPDADAGDHLQEHDPEHDPEFDPDYHPVLEAAE